jgi:hypothetical protein
MRGVLLAVVLLAILALSPSVEAAPAEPPGPFGGPCDGLVDVGCDDPWGTPNGAICILAIGGHCLIWM